MVARFRADTLRDKGRTAFQRPSLQSQSWLVVIWPVVSVLESLQLLLGFCGTLTLNILVSDLQHGLQSSASVFGIFLQLLSTAVYLQQFFPQHCGHGFSRITV